MIRVTSFGEVNFPLRDDYIQRIKRLIPFEWKEISIRKSPSHRTENLLPEEEKFLKFNCDFYLLDIHGKNMSSDEFYRWCFQGPNRHLIVGPSIGFHEDFRRKSTGQISLSPLTLTHGLAQCVLAESLYRAVCISKNHPFAK